MDLPPKSLVKSRKNLQAISKFNNPNNMELLKYEEFDRLLIVLWQDLRRKITNTQETKHIINLNKTSNYQWLVYSGPIAAELIEILKKEYPGVDFAYKEQGSEKVVVMDWS